MLISPKFLAQPSSSDVAKTAACIGPPNRRVGEHDILDLRSQAAKRSLGQCFQLPSTSFEAGEDHVVVQLGPEILTPSSA